MTHLEAELPDPLETDADYYFRPLGGLSFSSLSQPLDEPGPCGLVATSSEYGLVVFSNLSSVYIIRSSELLKHASKEVGQDSYQPPLPHMVCMAILDVPEPASQLALSMDQLVLACVSQNSVAFFSMPDLAVVEDAGSPEQPPPTIRPVKQLTLDATIKQFRWCKAQRAEADAQHYLVVTDDQKCQVARFPAAPQSLAENVEAADWQPGGSVIAYSSGSSVVFQDMRKLAVQMAEVDVTHPDVDKEVLVVESVHWIKPQVIMLSCSEVDQDQENGDIHLMQLTLPVQGLQAAAQGQEDALEGSTLAAFTPVAIEPDSTGTLQGPYLHCATVDQWDVVVMAHRKSNDDHMQLVQVAPEPQQLYVTHDDIRLALPYGPGGDDNYVLGLAVDLCADTGPIMHPLSAEPVELVNTPILIVATSDAALRLYAFGHFRHQEQLSHPPKKLPTELPAWLEVVEEEEAKPAQAAAELSVPRAGTVAEKEQEAAQTPLPDSEDDLLGGDSESGSCQGTPERADPRAMARKAAIERAESLAPQQSLERASSVQTMGAAQQQWQQEQMAAATALPSDEEDNDLGSGSDSTTEAELHVRQPAHMEGADSSDDDEVTSSPAASPEVFVGHGKRHSTPDPNAPAAKATSYSPASATGRHATTAPAFQVPAQPPSPGPFAFSWVSKATANSTGAESPPPAPATGAAPYTATTAAPATAAQPVKPPTTSGLFGNAFGASAPAWGSNLAPPALGGSIFGSSASFGAASTQPTSAPSLFGAAPAPSLFGTGTPPSEASAATTTTTPELGGAPQAPTFGGSFGAFGGALQPPQPPAASPSPTTTPSTSSAPAPAPATPEATTGAAVAAPKAKQPPMPSMAAVQQAQGLLSNVAAGGAGGTSAAFESPAKLAPSQVLETASPAWRGNQLFGDEPCSSPTSPANPYMKSRAFPSPTLPGPGLFAPPQSVLNPTPSDNFHPNLVFSGPRPGWFFSLGFQGQGYYKDMAPPPAQDGPSCLPSPAAAAAAAVPAEVTRPTRKEPVPQPPGDVGIKAAAPRLDPSATARQAPLPEAPVPKAKLADEAPELARMETDFLQSLHEVRRMTVDMEKLVAAVVSKPAGQQQDAPQDGAAKLLGHASVSNYSAVSSRVADLTKEAATLKQLYESLKQDVARLSGGSADLERRLAALQLFQRGGEAHASLAEAEKHLPLEPGLERAKTSINAMLQNFNRCMEDLSLRLESLDSKGAFTSDGSNRPPSIVVYDTLALQGETMRNLQLRIHDLHAEMERLGIAKERFRLRAKALPRLCSAYGEDEDEDYASGGTPGAYVSGSEGEADALVLRGGSHAWSSTVPWTPLARLAVSNRTGINQKYMAYKEGLEWQSPGSACTAKRRGTPQEGVPPSPLPSEAMRWKMASKLVQATQAANGQVRTTVVRPFTPPQPVASAPAQLTARTARPRSPASQPLAAQSGLQPHPPSPLVNTPAGVSSTGSPTKVPAAAGRVPSPPSTARAGSPQPGAFSFNLNLGSAPKQAGSAATPKPAAPPSPAHSIFGPGPSSSNASSTLGKPANGDFTSAASVFGEGGLFGAPSPASVPSTSPSSAPAFGGRAFGEASLFATAPSGALFGSSTAPGISFGAAPKPPTPPPLQPQPAATTSAAPKPFTPPAPSAPATKDGAAVPAPKAKQPPMPSMTAVLQAQGLLSNITAGGAGETVAASTPAVAESAPAQATLKPKAAQPPMPSLADMQAAQQLQNTKAAKATQARQRKQQLHRTGSDSSDEAASQGSTATSKPVKRAGGQPPVPSMQAMVAAQNYGATLAAPKPATPPPPSSAAQPAQPASTPPASEAPKPKPKSSQPPMPDMSALLAAQNLGATYSAKNTMQQQPQPQAALQTQSAPQTQAAPQTNAAGPTPACAPASFTPAAKPLGHLFSGFSLGGATEADKQQQQATAPFGVPPTPSPSAPSQPATPLFDFSGLSFGASRTAPTPAANTSATPTPSSTAPPAFGAPSSDPVASPPAFRALSAPAAASAPQTASPAAIPPAFSAPPAASGLFGAPQNGMFGAAPTPPASAGGIFGSAAASAPSGGLFGSTAASAPAGGLFGFQAPAPPASAPAPNDGLFGSAASTPPAPAPSLFGCSGAAPSPAFGGSMSAGSGVPGGGGGGLFPGFGQPASFGQPSCASAPAFGACFGQGASPSAPVAPGFGAGFGQPAQPNPSAPSPPAIGFGAFGKPLAPPATGGGFSAFAQPQSRGGFASFSKQGVSDFGGLASSGQGSALWGGGGFGGLGGGMPSPSLAPPTSGNSAMWAPRK